MSTTTTVDEQATTEPEGKKKRRPLKLLLVLVVVVAAAAGAWFFFLAPGGDSAPKPGEVAPLDSIQINLADGHYLRLGIALQLTESSHEVDGSKALDAAIDVFSGRSVGEVNRTDAREKLRSELEKQLEDRYEGEVMGVYFTEFVTQ
ncbi:MAG TPA: flagellar basal body-associated FliL family protein [Nocardioides sp.]|nr:flagellar basal body-associated FliL family protein [Nocardioides sp.]